MLPGIRRSRQARVIPHAPRWRRFCRLVSICHPERSEGSAVEGCRHICVPKCRFLALLGMTFLFRTAFFHCVCHNFSPMDPKHRSRGITDGRDRAGARASGGTPMEFNTIAISDGETMGTEGMRASLVSREIIADSIELVCRGQMFDAVVCVVGCDKTIPAAAMALARMNLPGLVLYGGTIAPGSYKGKDVTIQDVFEAVGANAAGKITDTELSELENVACPGAGACGGQYTANTMSTVMEMIGLSPMGFNSVPAMDPAKDQVAFDCGKLVMDVLQNGIKPREILTREAFENAIAGVAATGGS